jgi:YgiT-type zinc finger domain-containing protein
MLNIKTCPTCGSKRIRKVRRTVRRGGAGHEVSVPDVILHECPDCGERLYSPEALRRIQSCTHRLNATA